MSEHANDYTLTKWDKLRILTGVTSLAVDIPLLLTGAVEPHSAPGRMLAIGTMVVGSLAFGPLERMWRGTEEPASASNLELKGQTNDTN